VALPVPDESSLWANYISRKSLYLTPIWIIPDDCDLLTALLFPDSVYLKDKAIETTIISISNPISTIAEELIGSLSCLSCSPMEMALAAILLEAKNNHDNIRSKESLSLLGELTYKLKAYPCKKRWIGSDPEFILELDSYSSPSSPFPTQSSGKGPL